MKNSFKHILWLVPLLLAGSVYGHTLSVVNMSGTNSAGYVEFTYRIFPPGVTKVELTPWFVADWNSASEWQLSNASDYVALIYADNWGYSVEEVIPDLSIQDAFNQGLYWSAAVVGVLLAFSIIRTIPGGGHEEI